MSRNFKKNENQTQKITLQVLEELKDLDIYLYKKAVTTSSVYLKFKDSRLRSLTIRDHKTIPKYRYKWNIVLGYNGQRKIVDNGASRFFYSEKELPLFYKSIRSYYSTIKKEE
jgi:hypothetical protein